MILAVDMGNSNIVVGGLDDQSTYFEERITTDDRKTSLEYAIMLKNILEIHKVKRSDIEGSIISSVVPPLNAPLSSAVKKITGKRPFLVGSGMKTGLNIKMDNPKAVGGDRIVAAVAAIAKYEGPIIIIDMGTATTMDVVDKAGSYIGGVILPSVLELAGGWALYKLYHTRWWDYSDFPFNIGGYICLEFSLLWGVGTVVVMKAVHPVIAGLVEMVPQMVGFVLMCILYACYAADVVVTAFAASDLARELDALEKVADSMHAVSDAMTELLGTTAMDVDQKMDESRLQLKLAAAEARDNAAKLSPRDAAAALRAKADEAMEAARKSSQEARLNASEAATAVKLAAKGTAERTAELLRLEQLAEELQARSEEMRARTRSSKYFGKGRMLRAYPKLRHGEKHRSLDELRERLKYERRH